MYRILHIPSALYVRGWAADRQYCNDLNAMRKILSCCKHTEVLNDRVLLWTIDTNDAIFNPDHFEIIEVDDSWGDS